MRTAQCPAAPKLSSAVEKRLGRLVFVDEQEADLNVVIHWSRHEPHGFSVFVELLTKEGLALGTRTLHSSAEGCNELDDSLALVLALMLDVSREEWLEKRAQVVEGDGDRIEPPKPTPILVPNEPAPKAVKDTWGSSLLTTLSFGRLPGAAVGLRTRLYWKSEAFWGTTVDLSYFFERIEHTENAGSSFSAVTGGLAVCPLETRGGLFGGSLCSGVTAGRIHAQGFGFLFNRTASRLILDVALRGGLTMLLSSPLRLELGAEGWVNTQRHRFFHTAADGSESGLFVPPLFGATAELGLGLSFE